MGNTLKIQTLYTELGLRDGDQDGWSSTRSTFATSESIGGQRKLLPVDKKDKKDLDVEWSKIWNMEHILEHCVTPHSKDTND